MDETTPLTARQRRILEYIRRTVRDRGYPPTVREIGEAVGLTSSSSVHSQLANLERRGLLTKDPTKPRAPPYWPPRTWRSTSRCPAGSRETGTSSPCASRETPWWGRASWTATWS